MAKASSRAEPIKTAKNKGEKAVKQAVYNTTMERLTRLGYAVKGFLYVAMGFISIAGALGKSTSPADQLGAIVTFSKLPYAEPLLWIILFGMISYSLWGVVGEVLDPLHKGNDLKGLLTRGGYLVSAVTYASFAVPTYHLLIGARGWNQLEWNC